ncbi:MAG TPA: hypothetical protein VHR43_05410 [Gemmatimonadales bacterium]|nr:hypothetical protein [Gemmatimonadales bacterium]
MSPASRLAVLALLAGAGGCSDPSPTSPASADHSAVSLPPGGATGGPTQRAVQERLARRLALALADPAFRASIRSALDQSTVVEHKLHLQRWLELPGRSNIRALASAAREPEAAVGIDLAAAPALEFYLPVPAHRAAWHGGPEVLVATATTDHEAPVAFDIRGRRRLLDPATPPTTPVLAVVPVETDFDRFPSGQATLDPGAGGGGGGGGGSTSPPPGLYMTNSHFVQDFEGWLKGNPEFEIHILGQSGASDSLTSYQCAGEHAGGANVFDQNGLEWSGSVLLFTQAQLDNYKKAHPGQSLRILALEDDDGACQIRLDGDRFRSFQSTLQSAYPNLTGGKDSTSGLTKVFRSANALQRILRAAYSWITSQDDLIGNAIEDKVIGEYHAGANWIVRGDGNVTNGWLKLEMR